LLHIGNGTHVLAFLLYPTTLTVMSLIRNAEKNRAVCLIQANTILEMRGLSLFANAIRFKYGMARCYLPLSRQFALFATRQSADSEVCGESEASSFQ
jgi:hypothetical protein